MNFVYNSDGGGGAWEEDDRGYGGVTEPFFFREPPATAMDDGLQQQQLFFPLPPARQARFNLPITEVRPAVTGLFQDLMLPQSKLQRPWDYHHQQQQQPMSQYRPRGIFPRSAAAMPNVGPGRECKFCKNNGKSADEYQSHILRHPTTNRLVCPALRNHTCEECGATGDNAHTKNYCPKLKHGMRQAALMGSILRRNSMLMETAASAGKFENDR